MHNFLFRCPMTGLTVQGHLKAQELPTRTYVSQHCPACGSIHLVNPHTGKLMSEETGKPQGTPRLGLTPVIPSEA